MEFCLLRAVKNETIAAVSIVHLGLTAARGFWLMKESVVWRLCWLTLLSACLLGCGARGDLASVRGKVTLDGQPLPDAFVVFAPTKKGTTSYGRTDAGGNYEMMFTDYQKGAWIGENSVRIST